jgi:programmed cell death protein 5
MGCGTNATMAACCAVARIAIVKPEKARAIEDMVIQMAQRGQLAAKIDEDKLIDLLNQVGINEEKQRTKVTVRRELCAGRCEG